MRSGTIRKSTGVIALAAALLLMVASLASAQSRLEVGLGFHGGDPELSFGGSSLDLDTDTGLAGSVRYWRDGVGSKTLSIGLEFLHLRDSDFGKTATFTGVISGTATVAIEPEINAFMFNAALRTNSSQSKLHPYIGVGVGFARVNVDVTVSAALTLGGTTFSGSASADDSDTGFAWQLYAGLDYDLGSAWYIGLDARYFVTDVKLFGVDVDFRNSVFMAKLGYRF